MLEVKCPRCGQEYELAEDRPGKALGWLCAVCWQEKQSGNEVGSNPHGGIEKVI